MTWKHYLVGILVGLLIASGVLINSYRKQEKLLYDHLQHTHPTYTVFM